jgi:hypothetical protein
VITPKGKEAFNNAVKPNSLLIRKLFSNFSPEEMHSLRFSLRKLREKVYEDSQLESVRMDPEMSDRKRITKFLNKHRF